MLKNMFKTAWRSAIRHRQFSLLNLLGLSIGITTCLLITLYVQHELSYDRSVPDGDRIYRIDQSNIWGDWTNRMGAIGPNVALRMEQDIPEFEETTRVLDVGFYMVSHTAEDGSIKAFKEDQLYAVDRSFFNIFPNTITQGDQENALIGPGKMVLTETMAQKYFGDTDPIGKVVKTKFTKYIDLFTVSAVVQDPPEQSHLQYDFLVSMESYQHVKDQNWKWIWTAFATYGKVKPGADMEAVYEKLQALPPKYAPRTTETIFNQSFEDFTAGNNWTLHLNPLSDIYLDKYEAGNALGPTGNLKQIQIFVAIGIVTLLLSCINFMNLSTARSANRGKEVGIRKVLGSKRKTLVRQFVFESVLFAAASMLLAIVITEISLNAFNQLADKELSLNQQLQNPAFLSVLVLFLLFIGLLAGSYPAFYLSSFKPIATLKGQIASGFKGKRIRNGLVVFQFTISAVLVICAFFVQRQLAFSSAFDLGYDRNNLLQLHNIEQFEGEVATLKNMVAQNPAFEALGHSSALPPAVWSGDRYKAKGSEDVVQLYNMKVDEGYLQMLNPTFIAGRNFDQAITTDKYGAVLNESAVKMLGWGSQEDFDNDSPVGKTLNVASGTEFGIEVIGVVEDFNFLDLKNEIGPLVILHLENDKVWDYNSGLSFFSIRLNPESFSSSNDLNKALDELKANMLELDPALPFEYSFMDEAFEHSFRAEQRMGKVLNLFTAMAIVIACLGLFGLAAFSAEQRKKELGVRKVLGAGISQLVVAFSTEFTRLVIISLFIATPLAYLAVDRWLEGFAYKTSIDPAVFIIAGVSSVLIAWGTISFQSLKAAFRNPVDSLRNE